MQQHIFGRFLSKLVWIFHPAANNCFWPILTQQLFCIAGSGACRFDWSFESIERLFPPGKRGLLPGKLTIKFLSPIFLWRPSLFHLAVTSCHSFVNKDLLFTAGFSLQQRCKFSHTCGHNSLISKLIWWQRCFLSLISKDACFHLSSFGISCVYTTAYYFTMVKTMLFYNYMADGM